MKKLFVFIMSIIALSFFSCKVWMSNDNIFEEIEEEVKVANATKVDVFVRYAMNKQGKTDPDGTTVFKVGIPHRVSAVTEPEYGFVKWAAFSTSFISKENQNKNKDIYFIDNADYEARIKPYELGRDVVEFGDPLNPEISEKSTSTVVTIKQARNDIYLVPIIAQRPTVFYTNLKSTTKAVKNFTVQIQFSKPMDPKSFKNEDGAYDKITVTQGIMQYDGGDSELISEDITDHFKFDENMFSKSYKTIFIKFKDEYIKEGYVSNSSVTITISKEVKDEYGFEMTDHNEISFSVGNMADSLAPRITWLSAGSGENFEDFMGVYEYEGTINSLGGYAKMKLEGANKSSKYIGDDIKKGLNDNYIGNIEDSFFDNYIVNRIGQNSNIILRVFAEDLAGAGSGQSLEGMESDVTRIGIRAVHLYNSDGTEDVEAKMTPITYLPYASQQNTTTIRGSYRDLVNNANDKLKERENLRDNELVDATHGSLFEYDLSAMPDGLIRVDVAAIDHVDNQGFYDGGSGSSEYGNGYASLFIVKDTTAPDAEANKNFVQADLSVVPNGRGMFNEYYYKKLAVIQTADGIIKDKGHNRLISPNSELKWIVNPGSDTSWQSALTPEDERWKLVSEGYTPAESSLPAEDGPVDFTYALMDNLGNISKAVIFNSVTYDNTQPEIGDITIIGINGYISQSITGNILENQVISIPVSDETAGLESITISTECIKAASTYPEYKKPFESNSLLVKVDDEEVKYSIKDNKLTFKDTIVGECTVTIQGLQIADANDVIDDSTYRINITVTDAALNTSTLHTCNIKNDSTAPVINYIKVENINSGILGKGANEAAEEYWTTEERPQTALYINLTETNTGVKVFDFAGSSIKLRDDSVLIWKNEELPADVIEIDTAANKLTITDEYKTIITEENGGTVIIRNVDLAEENRVSLTISDLVTNKSSTATTFTVKNGVVIDLFKYDSETPSVTKVVLKDQEPGTGGNAETGFTDSEYVEATVSVSATASGVYQITVDGASFGATTLVNNKQAGDETEGFAVSADGRTITLRTSGNTVNRLLKETFDIKIGNVKLPAGDGDKAISFTVTSLAERTSAVTDAAQAEIRLDKTAPAWIGDGIFVAASNAGADGTLKSTIYPHSSTSASGNIKIGGSVYFYTNDTINIAADVSDTNRKDNNVDLFIDDEKTPVAEFKNVAPGTHLVYAVDKAGNKSEVKTFYVIADISGPDTFDSYITFAMPTGGNIYRGNSDTDSTKNYILKQNASAYKLLVKLAGVTIDDVDVNGTKRAKLNRYAELDPLTTKSPIEYYAFSTDGTKDWKRISSNGQITINLPHNDADECTPYTIYLKDGCGNISSELVPVNWKVDGIITLGEKDLSDDLRVNTAKGITYYKGDTTPVITLTGFNDSCYYPNVASSTSSNTVTDNYTLKSRILVWTDNSSEPAHTDFYSTTIDSTRFSQWSYLTLKAPGDSLAMTHHYPNYDTVNTSEPAVPYKLYYIVEDKLGNYKITQLNNDANNNNTELWMYDNTPPRITVDSDAAGNVNMIDNINYYSDVSSLSLNIKDDQSGIEWDGSTHYEGNNVLNQLTAVTYSLETIDPRDGFTLKINGLKDFALNEMPDTEIHEVNAQNEWVKQTAPTPAATAASIIGWDGTANGTSNYTSELSTEADGSKKISVKSPRSVTNLKFGFKVNSTDTADMLGWIITREALAESDFEEFYAKSRAEEGGDITVLTRNNDDQYEYIYSKSDTEQKWEDIENKTQYFYAINRAGLISHTPIIVEFVENPVPAISSKTFVDVKPYENVNYIKESSTIRFVTSKDSQNNDVLITKCEFFIGNETSPALVKDFTSAPVTEYTLKASEASVLPAIYNRNEELTVKLYTATEQSEKYPLTDSTDPNNLAPSNIWNYDNVAPIINRIFVSGIKAGTTNGTATEYWTSAATPKASLYINLTDINTGAMVFDFAGSTINITDETKVTLNGVELPITKDIENNKLTIADASTVKTPANGGEVIVTDFDLAEPSAENHVSLKISDFVMNTSSTGQLFTIKNEAQNDITISQFKYDANNPTVNSVVLRDQEPGSGGEIAGLAENGYTDNEYIKATVNVTATDSGVYQVTVNGASFDETTLVNGKQASDETAGFRVSADGKTITLRTNGDTINRIIKGTFDLLLNNVKLPSGDGDKTVSFTVTNLANRTSADTNASASSIRLDKTAPAWIDDGVFVAASNANEDGTLKTTIYPHTSTSSSGNIKIDGFVYFYTKDTINVSAAISDTNRRNANVDLYIDNATSPVDEYTNVTPGTHTVYSVDRAGNKSAVKTFYVIEDISGPDSFDSYITFTMPNGGNIYRGNAPAVNASVTTQNYVIKGNKDQNHIVISDTYKIIVKLPGLAGTEKDVHGENRAERNRYPELDPLTDKAPVEYYAYSTNGTKDWLPINNGTITIELPLNDTEESNPYTVYLKDGCSNESSFTVPVHWLVDGSLTHGGKTLGTTLYANAAKNITYYKGDDVQHTPVLSLTSFNDTCYYPEVTSSTSGSTLPEDDSYTLKSRLLAWTNASAAPTKSDFYSTSIAASRLTDWQYLTLKSGSTGDSVAMQHHYPCYDVTTAYTFYYIVEDKLGNYEIYQLKNAVDSENELSLWMYDNTPPAITVGADSEKINTVTDAASNETINYYSVNSRLTLNMTDAQSGIKYDGTDTYSGSGVLNTLSVFYPLLAVNPLSDSTIKVNGLIDYVDNVMPDSDTLAYHGTGTWVKQTVPTLSSTAVSVIDCDGEVNGTGGTSCGNGNYIAGTVNDATGGKRIKVKAPRSVTSMKFALSVGQKKYTANGSLVDDDTSLLGWIISATPLESFEDFYSTDDVGALDSNKLVKTLTRNDDGEYEYTYSKADTAAKWENHQNKLQYFYAVNRAGLICQTPIVVEFVENPVPAISARSYNGEVRMLNNINFVNEASTIQFTTNKYSNNDDVMITKAEFYIGNNTNPSFTKEFSTPVNTYTLSSSESNVLTMLGNEEFTVKLYTAVEESEKYPLTDAQQGLAVSNKWIYDEDGPDINFVKVNNISRGIAISSNSGSTAGGNNIEYWTRESTPKTDLYIKLTETNTGAKVFDFTGSTISLNPNTDDSGSKLYKILANGTEQLVSATSVDSTNKKLTIADGSEVKTSATGDVVKITNIVLNQTSTGNTLNLRISDYVTNPSLTATNFTIGDGVAAGTEIAMFKYDGNESVISSVVLTDRATGEGGNAEAGYTNEEYVNATINIVNETELDSPDSGVYKITVSNATFDSLTLVNNKSADDENEGFELSANGTVITLKTGTGSSAVDRLLKGTYAIEIKNLKLPVNDGDKNVIFTVTKLAERASQITENSQKSIILDTTNPVWVGDGVFVAESNASADGTLKTTIYPHTSTSISGNIKLDSNGNVSANGRVYFYTKDTINVAAAVSETNRKDDNADLYIDGAASNLVSEYTNVAPGTHTIYAVDKSGNRSEAKTFVVVGDTEGPAAFDGYVTFTMPSGGDIYRGNADTGSTKNYVIKQNNNPYKIIVKLPGVAGTENDVHGETRDVLGRYAELDPLADKSPIEYYSIDSETDWHEIGNGVITISLPLTGTKAPYVVRLKDGCSNITAFTVPVHWEIDGGITLGSKDISNSSLYTNIAKGISYYKINTTTNNTPVISLTGFNDSCYYPNIASSSSSTETTNYTLKSRVLAWANTSTSPGYNDFYATPENDADATRFTNWQYLTLNNEAGSLPMNHNYPSYDVTSVYKLYYIVEDKLGNYRIEQIKNNTVTDTQELALWMYDNTAPAITVGSGSQNVNTVIVNTNTNEKINYYSSISTLMLNMTDAQSGIEWDGTDHYIGNNVLNEISPYYPLAAVNPNASGELIINGLKDYAQNEMGNSVALSFNGTSTWVKQTAPTLPSENSVSIIDWNGTANGTSNYTSSLTPLDDGSKKITVKSPRSVTSLKFGLKVNSSDNDDMLGWIISLSPLNNLEDFYDASRVGTGEITVLQRNNNNEYEYIYTKTDTTAKWENHEKKLQYFYAVNRAGLICQKPIIVEFVSNPVPSIDERIITNVTPIEGINYNFLKPTSKIKFISDVEITKCEYYVIDGEQETLALTVPNTQNNLSLVNNNSFELTSSTILSTLTTSKKLKVKLYTATEESGKYELTDSTQGYAASNEWVYDPTEPEVKRIFVEGIKESTLTGETNSPKEYWSTGSDKETLFITLKEANTGVRVFNFAGSTIQLSEDDENTENIDESSKLYKKTSDDSWELVSDVTVDSTNNKLTIGSYAQTVKDTSAADIQVKITNVQLVSATSSDTAENRPGNKVVLALTDCASQTSEPDTTNHVHERFALDNTTVTLDSTITQIDGFNYDPSIPSVSSFLLRDRANITVGTFAIPVDTEFTNEREVTATVLISETESGISQLIVSGASFVTSGQNATTINLGSGSNIVQANIPYTVVSANSISTVTFSNNKVFKNSVNDEYFTITINNLLLPEYDEEVSDDEKQVTIKATNIGNKTSTITDNSTDTIILDMTPPVWNDARGLYTNKTDATIYPRSADGSTKAYGLANVGTGTSANDMFFYTDDTKLYLYADDITESHYNPASFIYFTITDGSIEETVSSTEAYGYLGLTLADDSDTCRFTAYVVDKAGNKTTCTDKAFTLVKDTDNPATLENYITFKQAMQGDVTVGQVFRGSSYQYVIKELENSNEIAPYKIIIKLASGVTTSDIKINGTNFIDSQSAYSELYKTTINNTNSFDAAHKAPIEYFAVTEGTVSVTDEDWISIFETEPQTAGVQDKLTVQQSNGEITISLPKATTCNSLKIHLKDGCGHTSSTIISPDNTNSLTWIVDGAIGTGNYAVEFNGTNSAVEEDDNNAHVVINNPYDITDGTGGGFAVNYGVTYYKLFGGTPVAPKLKLSYVDECVLPDGYSSTGGTEYTLRGRLIAWKGDTAPDYAQFALDSSTDEITLTRAWATDWVPVVIEESDTDPGVMEFDFPAEKLASAYSYTNAKADTEITGSTATGPYELWYVVEDAVGNSKIMQVKNRDTSSSANVTNWMYDNHAPTLNQSAEVSFEKVNTEGTNYYYSTNSKATYKIRDDWSGVITNSELIATSANKREANTTSKTIVDMSVETKPYVEVADLVGNIATLYLTADGTSWLQQTVPTLPTSDYITIIDWDGTSNGTSNYQSTLSSVTGGKKISVQSPRSVTSLKFGLKANQLLTDDTTDTTNLSGWIIRTSPLNDDDSDESNNFEDFYSLTRTETDGDITVLEKNDDNEYEYTYTKTTTKWEEMSNAVQYFYAVNKAGLICHNPIIVEFAENPVPAISSKSYSQVYTLNNINYINNNTTITFASNKYSDNTTVVPITKAEFYIGDSNTPALTKNFTTSPVSSYTLTTSESTVLPTLSNNELTVKLYTATEESEKYPLTDTSQNLAASNSWMFDNVKPVIEYVKVNNISKGVGNNTEYWTTENTPQTALYIKFTETNTGVKVFDFAGSTIKLRADTVLTWNGSELPATDITINTTANKLTINDDNLIKTAAAGGEATLTNVDLTSETTGNSVNLVISDYVENASVAETNFTTQNNTEISMFKYDNGTLTVNSVSLEDMENDTGVAAENGYTNDEYVKATLNVTATSAGIYKITVDGASFDNTTLVNGKGAGDATEGFTVSADGKTITLKTSNNTVNRILNGTNTVVISNAKLPSGDGDKTVSFTVTNLAERTSQAENNSIILDKNVPAWVGDGVYVADSNNNTTTIYPHTSTASSGNVKISGSVYFYTKDSINIAASVTDENRKASNVDLFIDSSTTPVSEYTSVTPGTHTVYAVDKAGNKSSVKTFYVVEDTTAPAAFDGYVTFTIPSEGNIYRGNADTESTKNYVINEIGDAAEPYKIFVQLGGVTTSDKDVHGNARSALSGYAELNTQTSASPIEYYKISGDSVTGTGTVNTDWIVMPANGIISVNLPKSRDCSVITITLKDGCSNETSYTVPVNWKVDGSVTIGSESNSSALYLNIPKGITYYKGDTTPLFSLTGFDDSCYYPGIEASTVSTTTTSDYTLKTRVLAWPNNSTVPERDDFSSSSIDSTRFSPWSYLTLKQSDDSVEMTHNYPKYNSTSAYKLYYIVEDKLGNYTIKQIKNGSDVLWMYDNTAPSIEVVPIATSPSVNINTVGNTNYYSASSKLKLNVTDTQSGIKDDGVSTYSGNGVLNSLTVDYPLESIEPIASNQLIISGLKDYVDNVMGNSSALAYNGKSTWVKQTAPTLGTTSSVSITAGTKDETLGRQSVYTSTATSLDNGSKKLTINAPRYYTSLTVNLKVDTTDNEDLLGWVIKTEPLTATQLAQFYSNSNSDVDKSLTKVSNNEFNYIYTKSNTDTKWETIGAKYFYAVNRAGLICQNPIIVEFVSNPVPVISGNVTYTNIQTANGVNYIKTGTYTGTTTDVENPSNISFTSDIALSNIKLISGSVSENFQSVNYQNGTNTYTIVPSQASWSSLATDKLTLILSTANEDSDLIYLTKNKTAGWTNTLSEATDAWTYDATRPNFTISAVNHSDGTTAAVQNPANTGTYFVLSDTAKLTLNNAFGTTDIAKYQFKLSSASSWTDWTTDYTLSTDSTAKTYNIRAIDKAGNPSEPQSISVQKDVTGPSGSVTPTYTHSGETTDNTKISASTNANGDATTVFYNPSYTDAVTLTTSSVTDSGAGVPTNYLYYRTKMDSATEWVSETDVTGNSFNLTLAENHIYYCEVIAKDKLGNSRILHTYTFNGMTPNATVSHSYLLDSATVTNEGTQKYSESNTGTGYTVFYNHARVNKLKVDVTGITGNTVTLKRQTGSETAQEIATQTTNGTTSGSYTFSLTDSGSVTYRLFVTDVVGYEKTLATFTVNGNAPGGSVGFDSTNNSSTYTRLTAGETNDTVYFNHSEVNTIKLTQSNIQDAAFTNLTLKYQKNSETPVAYPSDGIPCPIATDSNDGYYAQYSIFAEDSLGNKTVYKTYILNGRGPSGNVSPVQTETAKLVDSTSTIYFKSGSEGVSSISLTNNSTAPSDIAKLYYKVGNGNLVDITSSPAIPCPEEPDYTATYELIAEDNVGNRATLNTYTLNGAGPNITNASYSFSYKKDGNPATTGAYESGNTIYYSSTVDTLVVTVEGCTGYNPIFASTGASVSGNACTFTLPTSSPMTATYTITVSDGVGNTKTLPVIKVDGNGSVAYDTENNSSAYTKLVTASPNDIIYFNSTGTNTVTSIKLKRVNIANDATLTYKIGSSDATTITNEQLPCNLNGQNYSEGVTYQIYANNTLVQTYTLISGEPSASENVSNVLYLDDVQATAATSTSAGDYLLTTATNNGISTDTIIYNPTKVNKIKITTSAITDCGVGGSYYILKNGDTEETTHYTPVTDKITIELGSDWSTAHTYQVIARDGVGNSKVVKAYSFRVHTIAPKTNTMSHMNGESNRWGNLGFDVDGIANAKNNGYKITSNSNKYTKTKDLTGGDNGDYAIIGNATAESPIKISIPINNVTNLLDINGKKYVSYSISYSYNDADIENRSKDYTNENNRTTPWTSLQEVTNNQVIIDLKATDVPCLMTYLFVWLSDPIGNYNVYTLLMPEYDSNSKWRNWWTADTEGPNEAFTYTVKKSDWNTIATENTDYTVIKSGNIITLKYNNSMKQLVLKLSVTDTKVGLKTLLFDNGNIANNSDKYINLSTQAEQHIISAEDNFGNTTTWTLNLVPVTSLTNSSTNIVGGFTSGISGISSTRDTSKPVAVSQPSQSYRTSAFTSNFADTVTDLTPVTNTKKLRRTRKSSKKSEVKSENVVTEKPVQVIQSVITAAEDLSETAHNQHTQASDNSGDAMAELTDVTSVSAVSVESVIKSVTDVAENIGETSDDTVNEMASSEILVNQQILPQGEELVQSHSNYYEDEVVDLKLIYVVIAILLAAVAVVALIVITRKQKVRK